MKKIIIGIETSCDDTCVGILEITDKIKILSNLKINQNNLHAKYGGIVPEVAARSHINRLPIIFQEALDLAKITIRDVDLLSYTKTPGLLGSLLIGENFVKGLACQNDIPILGVNHLQAHSLIALIEQPITYPFLSLIISGGHTELWQFNSVNNYEILEKTTDDAIGELFDKVGRCMGLPFPAGTNIELLAQSTKVILPITVPKTLSFSGLKTKFIRLLEEDKQEPAIIANSLQKVVSQLLVNVLKKHTVDKNISIVVGGGVAANQYIKNSLKENFKNIFFPIQELCTDNGIMIAWCGHLLQHIE